MDDSFESDLTICNCMFAFKCTTQWEELTHTDDDKVDFYNGCQKEVHFCEDDDELAKSVRLNRCIAIYREGGMVMRDLIGRVDFSDIK